MGGTPNEPTHAAISAVTRNSPSVPATILAPITMSKTMVVVLTELSKQVFSICLDIVRNIIENRRASLAATAAASVGVNTPKYIPPSMVTIISIMGHIFTAFITLCFMGISS